MRSDDGPDGPRDGPDDGSPSRKVTPLAAFLAVAAVFTAGVLIGGVAGAVLLGLLAVGVGLLLAATWPRLGTAERTVRLVVLLVLVAVAVSVAT